jgi:hypothetical protein
MHCSLPPKADQLSLREDGAASKINAYALKLLGCNKKR